MSAVVYRVFDALGGLLYIGSTRDFAARKAVHLSTTASPTAFAIQVCAARWELEPHEDIAAARKAERSAIEAEAPFLNRQHNPTRWKRVAGEWVSLLPEYELVWAYQHTA